MNGTTSNSLLPSQCHLQFYQEKFLEHLCFMEQVSKLTLVQQLQLLVASFRQIKKENTSTGRHIRIVVQLLIAFMRHPIRMMVK